jgi:hypothetical protein
LWVLRDIRFHVLPRVLDDAKHKLTVRHLTDRRRAFSEFASALRLLEPCDPDDLEGPTRSDLFGLPESELRRAAARAPAGHDRALVEDAVRSGVHVFLTRDKDVLACERALSPFGLLIASPQDLLERLTACGAMHCLFDPERYAYWPFPDLQRVSHLISALPAPPR